MLTFAAETLSSAMSKNTLSLIETLRVYFSTQPIVQAWLFGSFSRGEERADSDVDILVTLDKASHVGFIKFSSMRLELEALLQRPVDLVVEGSLIPAAAESANRDKKLIYERAC